jgi:hypothetical protein
MELRNAGSRQASGNAGGGYAGAVLVPDLRPLSVGEIIDVAIKIWRRHLATLARIVFVVVAPVEILSALVAASVNTSEIETFDPAGNPTVDGGALAAWMAGMFTAQILSVLAFLIASAAVLRAVSVAYLGGTPDWKESLRAATARLRSLIWLGFLMFGGLALAAIALVVPAIWLGVAWALAFPVLIAEGQRGTSALGRSFRLVQGRWWPTFGALFLAFLFQFFLGLVFGIPLAFLSFNMESNSPVALAITTVLNVLASVITTPFMAAVLVLLYFDLRVRKEGFDLQLLSQGVGIPGSTSPADAPWLAGGGASGGHWGQPGGWPAGGAWPTTGGNWPPPGGNWPAPTGSPMPPGGAAAPESWGPPESWAPPDTRPSELGGDPQAPAAPRFEDPVDPTGSPATPQVHDPIDPTGPPATPQIQDPTEHTGQGEGASPGDRDHTEQ